jgi:flagellar biosynthetic protein FliR
MSDDAALLPLIVPVLLTVARCYGLAWTAPLLGSSLITARMRVALAVLLGVCGAAAVWNPTHASGIGWAGVVWHLPLEFVLGAALGCGARVLLAGLELAAGLIDQQAGLAGGLVLHPEGDGATSAGGAWLVLLGGLTWLTLAPLGGDLRIFAAWLDTLRALPPGSLTGIESPVRLVQDVMLSSLVLGLQVAAPVIVTAGLLQAGWAALARARGGSLWQPALAPARILVCLLVLAATATDLGERLTHSVDGFLRATVTALSDASMRGPG